MARIAGLALLAAMAPTSVSGVTLSSRANPIRKVVNLLKMMEGKVVEGGKKAEEVYEQYMCYCKDGTANLETSIAAAEAKIPSLQSSIQETTALHQQLSNELKTHKTDRASAKEAAATATALREKEATEFASASTEYKTNIGSIGEAVAALTKGMTGFLQTSAASKLQKIIVSMDDMDTDNRDLIVSFLSGGNADGYSPQSGEINGILKQMNDEMTADLASITSDEQNAIANYEGLSAAKAKEIAAATKAIEDKSVRIGDAAVELAQLKNDHEDTEEGLASDKAFVADLDKNCDKKTTQWAAYQKLQSDELLALADTIKLLNDDDALELFKKTLPSASAASFLQIVTPMKEVRQQAVEVLRSVRGDHRLDLLEMALHGQKAGFDVVLQKCDELVALLAKEQEDDNTKKVYCESSIDKIEDEKKLAERAIKDRNAAIDSDEESVAAVDAEIQAFKESLANLDKEVQEQTEIRKKQHTQTTETLAANNAAKELIEVAKNRLAKFYNPSLYKAAPKRQLAEDDRIVVSMGGTAPPTPAPGGIANTGIMSFVQVETEQAPEADLTYEKKGEEHGGVAAMMDLLKADLSQQNTELETEEKDGQADYEKFITDSAEKRKVDSTTLADKQGAKADLEVKLQKEHQNMRNEKAELTDITKEEAGLHAECDWLLSNFEIRKEARASESDALEKAKAVLSGADYS